MGKPDKCSSFRCRRLLSLGTLGLMIWVTPEHLDCQPESRHPIEVRLLAPTPNVCIGQSEVGLEAILTNTTDREIEISPQGVAHIIAAEKFEGEKQIAHRGGLRDIEYSKWISIPPHGSNLVPFAAEATDQFSLAGLLDSPGLIEVRIGFQVYPRNWSESEALGGTVYTNSVLLRVRKCVD